MELRQLRYFVAAAEEGNFGRAAERLHISAQGLSAQIRELEQELSFELFERLPRGVRLAGAGSTLLEYARRVLGEIGEGIERAKQVSQGLAGVLRVGHIPMSSMHGRWIGTLIPGFCIRYPTVELRSM